MINNERYDKIISILQEKKYVKPKELSQMLFVSHSTIRRDLLSLEHLGLIHKSHGQVSLFKNNEPSHKLRERESSKEKNYIASIALNYIESGMTIFLDSSTTTNALCPFLNQFKNLTIITNGIKTAADLSTNNNNHIVVTGGSLKPYSSSLLGETTSAFIESFNADIALFSCKSFDLFGVYEEDFRQGFLKNTMINQSKKSILLSDYSKIYKKNFYTFATYKDIDTVILNQKPDNQFIETCKAYQCEIDW